MAHSPIISKIRVNNPNKISSRVRNRNYLLYIGTRDGVDLTDISLEKELENLESPDSMDEICEKFIHERSKAHGLFGNIDTTDINKIANHVADETKKGKNIYMGILSLSEEDAVNLGYDQKEAWVDFMRCNMPKVAKEFGISITSLNWCAAVHMEKNHPHCHYIFWDDQDKVTSPYIHVSKQNKIRELLSGEIYKEEIQNEILDKTATRDLILDLNRELLDDELEFITKGYTEKISGKIRNSDLEYIAGKLWELSDELPKTGRIAYKLLPPDVKTQVDSLVEDVIKLPIIKNEFKNYKSSLSALSKAYSASDNHNSFTIDKNVEDIKKRLANQILKTSNKIRGLPSSINFKYDDSTNYEHDPDNEEIKENENTLQEEPDCNYFADWSKNYKKLIKDLYNPEMKNIEKIVAALLQEAKSGNVLAMNELGKIYDRGIKTDKNEKLSQEYYSSAFKGFSQLVDASDEKKEYFLYRLGKMHESGKGTEQDFIAAIECYEKASSNIYAKYSLGSLYLRHKGIEITAESEPIYFEKAMELMKAAADAGNSFASYTFAKNIQNRNIFEISNNEIQSYFKEAAEQFEKIIQDGENDFLLYRLGTMYYEGQGVEKDTMKALEYFQQSAEMNNPNALYALGKFYADKEMEIYNPVEAEKYFCSSIQEGNEYAKYSLAMLYVDKQSELYNPEKAIKTLIEAAEQSNDSAMYRLGKIYLAEEHGCQNYEKAISYFSQAAELGNNDAMYQLGKMYLSKEYGYLNYEKAISHLSQAAELKNYNAMYQLGKLYVNQESPFYNIKKGMDYLFEAAQNNNSYALAKIGSLYLWGKHEPEVERNIELGLQYLSKAVEAGNPYAQDMINFYHNCQNSIVSPLSYSMLQGIYRMMSGVNTSLPHSEEELRKYARQSKEYKKVQAKLRKHGRES